MIISFVLFFVPSKSQITGYMGKTFEISYTNQISSGIILPKIETSAFFNKPSDINSFRLEKAISKHSSLLINFGILNNQISKNNFINCNYDINLNKVYYDAITNKNDLIVRSKIFSIKHIVYIKGWNTPLGLYFSYGLSAIFTNYNNFDFELNENCNDNYYYSSPSNISDIKNVTKDNININKTFVDFSMGKKWILTNFITFHLGFNTSLTLPKPNNNVTNKTTTCDSYYLFDKTSYQKTIRYSVSNPMFFNIEAGIGFLIF